MRTEDELRGIIKQQSVTLKALKTEIAKFRDEKKKYQAMLKDLRWQKKRAAKKVAWSEQCAAF